MDQLRRANALELPQPGNYGALMLIDMDKFKVLNDTHGHDLGDMLLREVARRLKSSLREGDMVARLGGDEFVLVVVDIGHGEQEAAAAAEAIGKKLLDLLSQPYHIGNLTHTSAASIGITLFRGDEVSADDLLKQADLAMYRSKDSGRNVCRFFPDRRWKPSKLQRAALDKELRQALADEAVSASTTSLRSGPKVNLTGAGGRWSVGSIRSEVWCCRANSSPWPRRQD